MIVALLHISTKKVAVTKGNKGNCLPHRLHPRTWETNLETTYRNFPVRHPSDQCQTKKKT